MRAPARWPLAPLLALALRREGVARGALAGGLADVERRAAAVAALGAALRAHRDVSGRGRLVPSPGAAAALGGAARHAARRAADEGALAAALRNAEAVHLEALAAAERLRGELASARAAADVLEALRDAWRAARARDRERVEADGVDDAVSARWGGAW